MQHLYLKAKMYPPLHKVLSRVTEKIKPNKMHELHFIKSASGIQLLNLTRLN